MTCVYTPNTDFSVKDALPTGDPQKRILGSDFDAEFDEIATVFTCKFNAADGTATGTATFENITATGTVNFTGTFQLDGTTVTSTAAELNLLDGVTATTEEINYLDGVTSNIQDQITTINNGIARPTVITDATTARTLSAGDENAIINFTSGSAITVTVSPDSTTELEIGHISHLYQAGAGQITVAAGAGVTIRSSQTLLTRDQYSTLSIVKIAADSWYLVGDMEIA